MKFKYFNEIFQNMFFFNNLNKLKNKNFIKKIFKN